MAFGERIKLMLLSGWADTSTCKHNVITLVDPTAHPVTVSIGGVDYVSGVDFTLTQRGTDGPNGGIVTGGDSNEYGIWSGSFTSAGPSTGTQYAATISQEQHGAVVTDTFYFRTDYATPTACAMFLSTCFSTANATPSMHSVERAYIESGVLPVQKKIHCDDHGYADVTNVDDSAGTGHATGGAPWIIATQYAYWVAYLCYLGMLEDTTQPRIAICRAEDVLWMWRHCNYEPDIAGDHEYFQEYNWNTSTTGATPDVGYPNLMHLDASNLFDGPARVVWTQLWTPLMPPLLKNDATLNGGLGARETVAEHFCYTMNGNLLTVFGLDGILRASGDAVDTAGSESITQIYGNNMIDDMLDAIAASTSPFAMELSNRGICKVGGETITQQEVKTYQPTEYDRLYINGLMAARTNGVRCTFWRAQGDSHCPSVTRHYAAGEWYDNWCIGTENGGGSARDMSALVGADDGETEVLYAHPSFSAVQADGYRGASHIRLEMHPGRPDAIRQYIVDRAGAVCFSGAYMRPAGNDIVDVDYAPVAGAAQLDVSFA